MTKRTKKILLIVSIAITALLTGFGAAAIVSNSQKNCVDIIGDGYYMGTDPEPVVIGNTCDES